MLSAHSCGVVVYLRYLGQMSGLLRKADASGLMDEAAWMALRLAPDMVALPIQVAIGCNIALRSAYPLAGLTVPAYGEFAETFAGLQARIARAQALLAALPADVAVDADATISEDLWGVTQDFSTRDHLTQLMLPNFFFHASMVYALLRHAGLPLGKGDFDGFTPMTKTPTSR